MMTDKNRSHRMTTLHERIETALPIDEAFAFVADFANAARWDPGVATSERLVSGPVGLGARYLLGVRMRGRVAPMEYRITTFEPSRRVVLTGAGSRVSAVDDIRFDSTPAGTVIDYTADIRLGGVLRLAEPLLGSSFAAIGRDAAAGMRRARADQVAERAVPAAGVVERAVRP
jgi:carbon monoxide dehydrogenase subunit G